MNEDINNIDNENENIKSILYDVSLLRYEFQLSKEQSEEIDNYVLEVHKQYVVEKKKRRFFLFLTQSIHNFLSKFSNIGYLRPAIALGVLLVLISIFFYFFNKDSTSELATNLKEIKPELNIESPLTTDSNIAIIPLKTKTNSVIADKTKQDFAVNTQNELTEKDETPQQHLGIVSADEDLNMMFIERSVQGKVTEKILTREVEIKYDTVVALQKSTLNDQLSIAPKDILTESNDFKLSAQPLSKAYNRIDSPDQNLIFDGKYYKTNWKQLLYQNKPINFKIRSVYRKDNSNQYFFVKYEYEKTDKIDTSLETFQLETTGINLDSLMKMQDN